jgi:hypothetical protein
MEHKLTVREFIKSLGKKEPYLLTMYDIERYEDLYYNKGNILIDIFNLEYLNNIADKVNKRHMEILEFGNKLAIKQKNQ